MSALNVCRGNCDVGVAVAWKCAGGKLGGKRDSKGLRTGDLNGLNKEGVYRVLKAFREAWGIEVRE